MGERGRVDSVYSVKSHPKLRFIGMLVLGFVIFLSMGMYPRLYSDWVGILFGLFGVAILIGAFIDLYKSRKAVKEIEVGPKGITLRCRDGKKIVCQKIDKIAVGVFQRGRVWGRAIRTPVRWIGITGQTQDGKPWRTLIGKGGLKLGWKELDSLRDDLQRYFGSKIEEKKVRFA